MKRISAFLLMALTVTGFAFARQHRTTTFELTGVSGNSIRFSMQGHSPRLLLKAASLSPGEPGRVEATTPATISDLAPEPLHVALSATAPGDTLQLSTITANCEATRSASINVVNRGLPTEATYMLGARLACSGGTLVLVARQAVATRTGQLSEARAVLRGQRITLNRPIGGEPLVVQADLLTIGPASH